MNILKKYTTVFFLTVLFIFNRENPSLYANLLSDSQLGCIGSFFVMIYAEPLIPDLRYEYAWTGTGSNDFTDSLVLSWPLHLCLSDPEKNSFGATFFLEPQWIPDSGEIRGLGGTRFTVNYLLLEGGGIGGKKDGHGGFMGLGFALRLGKINFGIVFRTSVTNNEIRSDISFDFWRFNFLDFDSPI